MINDEPKYRYVTMVFELTLNLLSHELASYGLSEGWDSFSLTPSNIALIRTK